MAESFFQEAGRSAIVYRVPVQQTIKPPKPRGRNSMDPDTDFTITSATALSIPVMLFPAILFNLAGAY